MSVHFSSSPFCQTFYQTFQNKIKKYVKDHERNIPIVYKLHQSLFFFSFFLKITVSILASKKALLYTSPTI